MFGIGLTELLIFLVLVGIMLFVVGATVLVVLVVFKAKKK